MEEVAARCGEGAQHSHLVGAVAAREAVQVRTIVIDPGHGGTNTGAIGVGGIYEKHLTLPLALHLADRLRKRYPETRVLLTRHRDMDLSLQERIALANAVEADLFISLHFNAAPNLQAHGFETFWAADLRPRWRQGKHPLLAAFAALPALPQQASQRQRAALQAQAFAATLHATLGQRLSVPDRGIKQGDFTVLNEAMVPAVVVELGFMSHAVEGMAVLSPRYQNRMIDALVDAVSGHDRYLARQVESLREQRLAEATWSP